MTSDGRQSPSPETRLGLEHLSERVGLLDESDRGIVEVSGRRAGRMLTGLLTNELPQPEENRAAYTFLLTARGRPVAEARAIARAPNAFWLDVPATCREPLLEHLERMLPPLYARFEPRPDVVRLAVVGPLAEEALGRWPTGPGGAVGGLTPLGCLEPGSPDAGWILCVRREPEEGPGFDLYVSASDLEASRAELLAAVEATGGGACDREAYDIWRIERGVPAFGPDIGPDNLPQETGQQHRAISFSKGCYTGQEVVARIHYRGHVNRHLRGLRLTERDGRSLEPGQELYREERAVGALTSVADSPRWGRIGLGYVRREVEPGDRLSLEPGGSPAVEVSDLPFTDT